MASLRKIKIYAKLFSIGLVLMLVLMFIFSNREPISVDFLVWTSPEVPKFWFLISVATIGIVIYRISGTIRKVLKDFRQMKKEEKAQFELLDKTNHSSQTNETI